MKLKIKEFEALAKKRGYRGGKALIDFNFIIVQDDLFYKAVNQKFRFCFERVGVEFSDGIFGQLQSEFAFFYEYLPF